MSDYLIDGEILGDIADAIREKTNTTNTITPENMASEIASISNSSSVSLIGTWTVIDEPEIPTTEMPLSFTSNGENFISIGFSYTGSSSWNIRTLTYGRANGDYVGVYTDNPSGDYGITHGWGSEAHKTITVTEEPTDANAIAWLGANTDAPKIDTPSKPCFEMPQIRFAGAIYSAGADKVVSADSPLTLSVEIVGGGSLQEGDMLQICGKRTYKYNGGQIKKQKLRQQITRDITYEDIGKRFLNISTNETIHGWLFKNDRNRLADKFDTQSAFYLRIKRVTKYNSDGEECDAIFSNIVTVWKTYNLNTGEVNIK